jgi:predicted Fe-Mo cluster-binding NifX family protein
MAYSHPFGSACSSRRIVFNAKLEEQMKIAVSVSGNSLAAMVDPRFGRAAGFIIYDTETNTFEYKDNAQNLNAMQGAGIQSAKHIADAGAAALITGNCGPKAFTALKTAGVKVYTGAEGTVFECIEKFKSGSLKEAQQANVEGHWM